MNVVLSAPALYTSYFTTTNYGIICNIDPGYLIKQNNCVINAVPATVLENDGFYFTGWRFINRTHTTWSYIHFSNIDNTSYPTGYKAFYCYKYELSEQQYADFLNTLTTTQKTSVGVAGTGINLVNAEYFSSTPNKACGNSTPSRVFSIADWSGLRPLTILEFNKACFGPNQPVISYISFPCYGSGYGAWKDSIPGSTNSSPLFNLYSTQSLNNVGFLSNSISTRASSGASYYGIMDLNGNANEPVVRMKPFNFSNINGDGKLNLNGSSNINTVYWNTSALIFIDAFSCFINDYNRGFRLVRSAE